ncbi:single-strand binding protein family-domain-containing protein [Lyophyllum atratum]|nr:single-strand binding protein family-domain-containing protein [Lyophyllum atratum]
MFGAIRAAASRSSVRAFSTSNSRAADLSKLVLIGHLTRDPETRQTKNDREFVTYTVATTNYPPPPPDATGERRPSTSTFHRVLSFQEHSNRYLQSLKKGSKVYVEANFELREPEVGADPTTPQGQRQIFLKHETIRVLSKPKHVEIEED